MLLLRHNLLRIISKPQFLYRFCHTQASSEQFKIAYSFSFTRLGCAVNSLKLKQSLLTAVVCPLTYAIELQNVVPANTAATCTVIAIASNIVCYSVGQVFYKMVGKAYWNEEQQLVKLSYIGFFGQRKDIELPLEEVGTVGDESPGYFYTKLRIQHPLNCLKVNEKYFEFMDLKLSRRIFGEGFRILLNK